MSIEGNVKLRAFEVFDLLPRRKQNLVYELIINLIPDDVATPELIERHEVAMREYLNGETIDHNDID